jgi:hypothetical protein
MDFIQKYKKIHGRAFQAKLAFKNVVFLDGTFAKAFFAQPESTLSFNEAMRQMLVPDLTIGAHVIESPWHMPILRVALHPTKVAQNFSVNMEPLYVGGGGGERIEHAEERSVGAVGAQENEQPLLSH